MELILKNITKKFGEKTAVNNVSISFKPGIYGLLGANGAGKTTLMHMICSILKPNIGSIRFNNKLINEADEEYREVIGILPQDFGYYDDFSAYKFLKYISQIKGIPTQESNKRIEKLLELVNLTDEKNHKIKTFSGGMKRRLGIAQAIINDPQILVLDEPTAGLDPKERVKFRNIISNMSRDKIIILSTHIVSDIEYISDHVIIMKNGRIMLNDIPSNVLKNINDKVWICNIYESELHNFETNFNIININKVSELKVDVRIVSDNKPYEHAKLVAPTLEDLYLYYFPIV